MRTSDVKTKIVEAVEAVTPDSKASARDVFRHVDHAGRFGMQQGAGRLSDRIFHVSLASIPVRADLLTVDAYHVDYSIAVFYTAGQAQIEDRIGQDAERIEWALATVHSTDADLYNVTVTPGGVDEFEQVIEARLTARATYRLTGVS
jgi:hypothetical protein